LEWQVRVTEYAMCHRFPGLVFLLLGLSLGAAQACSLVPLPPAARASQAHAVVLAVPVRTTLEPARAGSSGYKGMARQRVEWEVQASWKGPYRRGRRVHTDAEMMLGPASCQSLAEIIPGMPRLVYLFDARTPHRRILVVEVQDTDAGVRWLDASSSGAADGAD
jgi:hypothetical protein